MSAQTNPNAPAPVISKSTFAQDLSKNNTQPTFDRSYSIHNKILLFNRDQDLNEIKTISIFSITGQKVMLTADIYNSIDLSSLKKGIYLLRIEKYDQTQLTSKIIISP